jgi:hypothetical protein
VGRRIIAVAMSVIVAGSIGVPVTVEMDFIALKAP